MSAPRIGQLLLARGACTQEDLYAAWEQKVLFGDRLGTNLLADARVDEQALALALGQQHRVRAGYEGTINVDVRIARALPAKFAAEAQVVPHHIGSKGLFVLMTNPHDQATIDQLSARYHQPVVPVVVAEARMWALLAAHYGISPGLRPIPLGTDAVLARQMRPPEAAAAPTAPGPELTSEADFEALYMREGALPQGAEAYDDADTGVDGVAATAEAMLLTSVADEPSHTFEVPPTFVGDAPDALADRHAPAAYAPVVQHGLDTPLPVETAKDLLARVNDRDEIAEIVLRAALSNFRRAALFTVHPGMIVGWKGRGERFTDPLIQRYRTTLNADSVFATVVKSRAHYIGPLARVRAHAGWVKHTHRKIPLTVALFPVLVRGHVVNLLYGDNGHGQPIDTDVADLLILAQAIARSYESLLEGSAA